MNQQKSGRKQVRHTLSVTFSISVLSSFRVWGKMTEERNTTFHLRSCLGRIKPPESITFATAVSGKWAKLLTLVPIMLTLNALSHWVEDQANRIRQTESLNFFYGLCTCRFLHPRPRLQLCKHPPPPSLQVQK